MFCPNCSDSNPDDAKFCGKCGRALPLAAPAPPGGAAALPAPSVSDGLKWGVAVASAVLPIIGLVMGFIYMIDASPAKKAAGKLWLIAAGVGVLFYLLAECSSTPMYY